MGLLLTTGLYGQVEDVFSIPVVVHVIYTDSVDTNISDSQIYSAIDALNDDFRKVYGSQGYGNGVDTEIEFCLASLNPYGYPTSGIKRYHCTGDCAMGYDTLGIDPSVNEELVKNLSRWPNTDYYNIWVVHKMGPSISGLKGFSPLPGGNPNLDGAVVLYNAFGIGQEFDDVLEDNTDKNRTITQVVGHGFDLYPTYEGDVNGTQCPVNINCNTDGDKCCDTDPHIRSNNDCNSSGVNACNNNSSNDNFVHNYMDNSSEDCKSEFTWDQRNRMRDVLLYGVRNPLLYSFGCEMPCQDINSQFSYNSSTQGNLPISVTFNNESSPISSIDSYSWLINGTEFVTTTSFTNVFNEYGTYWVCLDAINEDDSSCNDRYCELISITPNPSAPCPLVPNSDFETITGLGNSFSDLADWNGINTPWVCTSSNNYVGTNIDNSVTQDGFITSNELGLVLGSTYNISFDYSVQKNGTDPLVLEPIRFIKLIMSPISEASSYGMNSSGDWQTIATVTEPKFNYPSSQGQYTNNTTPCITDIEWSHFEGAFIFGDSGSTPGSTPEMNQYIKAFVLNNDFNSYNNAVYFDNIEINGCPEFCEGSPIIDYEINGCDNVSFSASNTTNQSNVVYTWNFGDGSALETGVAKTHTYNWNGDFTVVLTMVCSDGTQTTTKKITIALDPPCTGCTAINTTIESQQCGNGAYIGNFELDIPAGYAPCNEDGQSMYGEGGDMNVNSYYISEDSQGNTTMQVSVDIYPDDSNFTNVISGYITLCDENGNTICYFIDGNISGDDCDAGCRALPMVSTATCDLSKNTADMSVYAGSFSITPPPGFTFCDDFSESAGFSLTDDGSGNFSYTITTSQEGTFATSALIVFCKLDEKFCFTINIEVLEECRRIRPISRPKLRLDKDELFSDKVKNGGVLLVPNPTSSSLEVLLDNEIKGNKTIKILNQFGQLVYESGISNASERHRIDVLSYTPGLYFLQVSDRGNIINTQKLVITD